MAIVTYDASVHFYQVRNQQQPRMLVMPDIDEVRGAIADLLFISSRVCNSL